MKNNNKIFKCSVFFLILLNLMILSNTSVVSADSNAPTECRISVNRNDLYTNNRYVTLELYGTDADPMQVWVSNDGDTGTVFDFNYGTTITITDLNYTVGVAIDTTNSTTSTNSDNVLRIENWPLSTINGTKRVYTVFRDSYGNKTSITGLTTITISYDLNGQTGTAPSSVTTVKDLGVYIPSFTSSTFNKACSGWSASSSATIPNYYIGSISSFNTDTTLYAVYKTIAAGDYIYYPIDLNKAAYNATASTTGYAATYKISDIFSESPAVFRVLSASSSAIVLCPNTTSQTFSLTLSGNNGYNNGDNAIKSICALYAVTGYSKSTTFVTQSQMASHKTTEGLSTLFGTYFWIDANGGKGYYEDDWYGTIRKGRVANSNGTSDPTLWSNGDVKSPSYRVCPAITLNTTLRFAGAGNSSNPYTIITP